MTSEEFNENRNSVLTKISEKDKNPGEEFARMFSEIALHRYQFDRQEK